jgi:hypothetical protein
VNVLALPLAGVNKGWRKAVADRVAPTVAAKTPLEDHHARALVGAAFIGLSTYYVVGSVRRFREAESSPAAGPRPTATVQEH